jgi:hypothetical protein
LSTSEKTPSSPAPKFFVAGVDLGQKQDHSAVAVVEKRDKEFDLLLLKQFALGTEYGSVLGYLKILTENLHDLRRIMIDQTGVGETFTSMAHQLGTKERARNRPVPAKETGCHDFPETLHGGRTCPHTVRQGVHERAERRTFWTRSDGQTEVLTSARDP